MMHTAPMKDSDGQFSEWTKADCACRFCNGTEVCYAAWESSCGGYEDYKFGCAECGKTWWVDGPDA